MRRAITTLAALFCLAPLGYAGAATYAVTVAEGVTGGSGFDTTSANPFGAAAPGNNVASATFAFTGPLSFSDTLPQNGGPSGDLNSLFGFSAANVSNYSGAGTVQQGGSLIANYASLGSFLASSGSAGGFQYGSWYDFDLGSLAAGTVLTVTHDDGASLFQGGLRIGNTVSGPTSQVTDLVELGRAGNVQLYYSRQNGTPSILDVAIPEPMSLLLMAAGLGALFAVLRRRARLRAKH